MILELVATSAATPENPAGLRCADTHEYVENFAIESYEWDSAQDVEAALANDNLKVTLHCLLREDMNIIYSPTQHEEPAGSATERFLTPLVRQIEHLYLNDPSVYRAVQTLRTAVYQSEYPDEAEARRVLTTGHQIRDMMEAGILSRETANKLLAENSAREGHHVDLLIELPPDLEVVPRVPPAARGPRAGLGIRSQLDEQIRERLAQLRQGNVSNETAPRRGFLPGLWHKFKNFFLQDEMDPTPAMTPPRSVRLHQSCEDFESTMLELQDLILQWRRSDAAPVPPEEVEREVLGQDSGEIVMTAENLDTLMSAPAPVPAQTTAMADHESAMQFLQAYLGLPDQEDRTALLTDIQENQPELYRGVVATLRRLRAQVVHEKIEKPSDVTYQQVLTPALNRLVQECFGPDARSRVFFNLQRQLGKQRDIVVLRPDASREVRIALALGYTAWGGACAIEIFDNIVAALDQGGTPEEKLERIFESLLALFERYNNYRFVQQDMLGGTHDQPGDIRSIPSLEQYRPAEIEMPPEP